MKLIFTKPFIRAYRDLPPEIQTITDKQLGLLLSNPRHPTLHIKKMEDPRGIWEGRVTVSYRFTFQIIGDTFLLRKIGTHDILKTP